MSQCPLHKNLSFPSWISLVDVNREPRSCSHLLKQSLVENKVAPIYIPAKLIIIAKFLALWICLFETLEIWWLINNMKSLYYILVFQLAWIKSSFTRGQSSRRNPENTAATWPDGEKSNEVNPLSANFTKWSNTLKQFVGKLPILWDWRLKG